MATCCSPTSKCDCATPAARDFTHVSTSNTLAFAAAACIHCGMCSHVCPHGVFVVEERRTRIVRAEACMECGACMCNCPTGALQVDSGVGCAAAMIYAALTGKTEVACGESETGVCCG